MTQKKVETLKLLTNAKTGTLVKRLLRDYAKPHGRYMALGIFCMILVAMSTALLAKQMQPVIDDVFFRKDSIMLYGAAIQVFLIFFVKGAASYGESVIMGYVGQKIIADIQISLFKKIIRADFFLYAKSEFW